MRALLLGLAAVASASAEEEGDEGGAPGEVFAEMNESIRWPSFASPLSEESMRCLDVHEKPLRAWRAASPATDLPHIRLPRDATLYELYWLLRKAAKGQSAGRVTLELEELDAAEEGTCVVGDSSLASASTRGKRAVRPAPGPSLTRMIVQFQHPQVIWPYCAHDVDPRKIKCVESIHMSIKQNTEYIEYIKQRREWGLTYPPTPCTASEPCGLVVTLNGPVQRTGEMKTFYCQEHPEYWLIGGPYGGTYPAWYFEQWPFSKVCYSQLRNIIMYIPQREYEFGHLPSDTTEDFIMPRIRRFLKSMGRRVAADRVFITGWDAGGFAAYDAGVIYGQDIFSHVIIAAPIALQIGRRTISAATPIDSKRRRLRRVTFGVGTNDVVTGTSDPTSLQSVLALVHNNQYLEGIEAEVLLYPSERHYIHTHLHNKFAPWLWRGEPPFEAAPETPCEDPGLCRAWGGEWGALALALLLLLSGAAFWAHEERLRALCPRAAVRREEAVPPTELYWWSEELQAWLTRPSAEGGWEGFEGGSGAPLLRDARNSEALATWSPWSAVRERAAPPFRGRLFEGGLTSAAFNEVDRHVLEGHGEEAALASVGARGRVAATSRRELLLQSAAAAAALRGAGALRPGARVLLALPPGAQRAAWVEACKRAGLVYCCCGPGLAAAELAGRLVGLGAAAALAADAAPWHDGLQEAVSGHAALQELCEALARLDVADLRGVRALSPDGLVVPLAAVLKHPEVAALPGDAQKRLATGCCLGAKVRLSLLGPELEHHGAHHAKAAEGIEGAYRLVYSELLQATSKCADSSEFVAQVWRVAGSPMPLEVSTPLFIAYGSGPTRRPQQIVHCLGSHLTSVTENMRAAFSVVPGKDMMLAAVDAGGVAAQSYQITGPLCCRVTALAVALPSDASGRPARLVEALRAAQLFEAGSTVRRCTVRDEAAGEERPVYTFHCGGREVVNVDGAPVSAERMERAVMRGASACPSVGRCVVVGVPHKLHGEVPVACVVRSDPAARVPQSERDRLHGLVCEEVGAFPMALVVVDGVPETFKGKVVRGFIREIAMGRTPQGAVSGLRNPETLAELQDALGGWEAHLRAPAGRSEHDGAGSAGHASPLGTAAPDPQRPGTERRTASWEAPVHSIYGAALCMAALRQWLPPDSAGRALVAPAGPLLLALRTASFQLNAFFALGGLEARLEEGAVAGRREAAAVLLYVATALPGLAGVVPGPGPPHRWMLLWLVLARGAVGVLLQTGLPAALQIGGLYAAALALHRSPDVRVSAPGVRGLLWDLPDFGSIGHKVYWVAMYVTGYHWGAPGCRFLDRWMAGCSRTMRLCISAYAMALLAWLMSLTVENEASSVHGSARGFEDLSHIFGTARVYPLRVALGLLQLAAAFVVCRPGVRGLRQIGNCVLTCYALQPHLRLGLACFASGPTACALRRRGVVGGCFQLLLLLPFPVAYGLGVGAVWHLLGGLLALAASWCPQQRLLGYVARRWEPLREQASSIREQASSKAEDLRRDVLRRVDEARWAPLPARVGAWFRGSGYGRLSTEEGECDQDEEAANSDGGGSVELAKVYGKPLD